MSTTCPRSIAGMPNEVLLQLFQLLAADGSVSSKGARARIGRVCKRWRNVSRLNSYLWTLIIVDIEEPDPDADVDSDDSDSDMDVDSPDISFLEQSLYLSHPLPLDITVTYKIHSSEVPRTYATLTNSTLASLARYCIRWRTFKCTTPTSFIGNLALLTSGLRGSNMLETLSLRCNDEYPSAWDTHVLNAMDITLRLGVSHIEANFDMSSIKVADWASVTSLTAGFALNTYCHYVLSRTTALDTLFLLHLGREDVADDPPRKPTVLNSVRHLKLAPCTVLGFLDQFRFPQADQLSLAEPSEVFSGHRLSGGCPNRSTTRYDVETLCTTLALPGNPRSIRRLNIDWDTVPVQSLSTLSPLLRLFENSITALDIEFGRGILSNAHSFFHSLVITDKTPLLPNLSELHINEARDPLFASPFSGLFQRNAFEDMIVSRCGDTAIPVLRTLRLSSNAIPSQSDTQSLVLSSLCLTLQGLSSVDVPADKRLDVEWAVGGVDILQEGRNYAQMLY